MTNESTLRLLVRSLLREWRLVRGILGEVNLADRVPFSPAPADVDTNLWSGGGLQYGDRQTTAFRRKIKSDWNAYADHTLFQNPNQIKVVHFLGYYSTKRSLNEYFPVKTSTLGSIPGVDFPNKNELSCFGYVGRRAVAPRGPYFTFKKYRVTFASNSDAATERLSKAAKKDRVRMAGSGLAKRPGSSLSTEHYPLDWDDLPENDLLEEVVIDNWIIDEYHGPMRDRKRAEALGLKFVELT